MKKNAAVVSLCAGAPAGTAGPSAPRTSLCDRIVDKLVVIARLASFAMALALVAGSVPLAEAVDEGTTNPALSSDAAPIDHAALAKSYREEAQAAEAKAAMHERMLKHYQQMPDVPEGRPGRRQRAFGPVAPGSPLTKDQAVKHCQQLVDSYKRAASNAAELATAHASMAQSTR